MTWVASQKPCFCVVSAARPGGARPDVSRLRSVLVRVVLDGHGGGFFGCRLLRFLADQVGEAGDVA
jgi:hypothetical protein